MPKTDGCGTNVKGNEQAYYINNDEFEDLINIYQQSLSSGVRDEEILSMIVQDFFFVLTYNIIRAFQFRLIDYDDALQEGAVACLKKIAHFDPKRGKAFNFFTTLILNHLRGMFKGAKNYNQLRERFMAQESLRIEDGVPYFNAKRLRSYLDERQHMFDDIEMSAAR